nr:OB-fold nucleic acid binding domain-containing protein [Chloroflexota bacterium]
VPLVSIGEARAAAAGTHLRIRGVVTAQSGLLEAGSAVVQDSTAGILVRLGPTAGSLSLGQFVELDGIRSTKAGMLSLRVTKHALRLGALADPSPTRRATGVLGEADEARVVIARGVVSSAVSRPRGGAVSFAIDDGSGPIRVSISPRSGIATGSIRRGAWLELRGVLAQVTTSKAPLSGYRLWPRMRADLHVIAAPVAGTGAGTPCCTSSGPSAESGAAGGHLPRSGQNEVVVPWPNLPPILARAHPTLPPMPPAMTTSAQPRPEESKAPMAAGLVVSGMGVAALAALAAWFGRPRRPDDDAARDDPVPGVLEIEAGPPGPRLALLRIDAADAQEERRILPPI